MNPPSFTSPTPLRTLLHIALGLAFSVLSAVLLILSMPPRGIWPLTLVGFIPALLAQHRILPERLSSLAPAVAVGGFLGVHIAGIFGDFAEQVWFLKNLTLLIGILVFVMEFGTRRLHAQTGYRWFVPQGALVWVGIEMIRNLIPFIGTGGFIGYAYYRSAWLIQPVSIFGMFGLNLLSMLVSYTLGLAVIAWFDRSPTLRGWQHAARVQPAAPGLVRRWISGVSLASAAWIGLSLILYFTTPAAPLVRVAAVQPATRDLTTLQNLTRQAAAQGAQLVVWPEGALPSDPHLDDSPTLQNLARETGVYLAFGSAFMTDQGLRNEASVISPQGDFLGTYGKDHPVTFLGETSISRGSFPVHQAPFGKLGTIICYDLNFSNTARKLARGGAQLLAVPSNDWPDLYNIQSAYLLFRAVENRLAAVKADTQYDSVIIDPRGRVVAMHATPASSQAVLVADVALGSADAPQIFLGDWIGWISLAGLLFFALPNPLLAWKRNK